MVRIPNSIRTDNIIKKRKKSLQAITYRMEYASEIPQKVQMKREEEGKESLKIYYAS